MFSPFFDRFRVGNRYLRKGNVFAILTMSFYFQPVAYYALWKPSKIGTRLKEKAHRAMMSRKPFPQFHFPLARATCVGAGSHWTAVWEGLNFV